MCLADACYNGYYETILNSNVSSLEFGSNVCIPCDELCNECSGPENRIGPSGCQSCRFAARQTQCVDECVEATGKKFM
jgi:hypothetical protein